MSPFRPKSVPAGRRRGNPGRPASPHSKKHKDRPVPGKGQYIKAPLLRDKVTKPRWVANSAINNPGSSAAALSITGGGALALRDKDIKKRDDRKKDAAAGALIGGGAGQLARQGADYGAKAVGERQFKPLTTKGNYGPYTETEHKPVLNKYKRVANKEGGGSVRAKAKYFDENFPKGVPSYRARKVGVLLNSKGAKGGAVAGGAAVGAAAMGRSKVKKSAFGVDHG